MLPRFSIIQVGDVHLPSSAKISRSIDDKDIRFPNDLKALIAKHPLKKAFEKIYELIASERFAAVLFMGDLTDYGDEAGYRACAAYIANSLQIGTKGLLNTIPTGIVSGNHDINRLLAQSASNVAKFTSLATALSDVGLPTIPIKDPIWIDLKTDNTSSSVALLNSCWGCGSSENIPEEFREGVQSAIDNAINRGTSKREIAAYYERQLDTPAFSSDCIQQLLADMQERASNLFIVAAHHNLLPQRLPRLAPYTELVNSGALRNVLQEIGKPVVYLHGHIHQDPIEILHIPDGSLLVTIAAPEITEGFNVLEFVFTRGGMPLSCRVVKWRFDGAGYLKSHKRISIPLIGNRRRSHQTSLSGLYQTILDAGEIYWDQLSVQMASSYSTITDLEDDLELLETDHRITIENYDMSPKNWIIGAKI